jgi:hypothetical protein
MMWHELASRRSSLPPPPPAIYGPAGVPPYAPFCMERQVLSLASPLSSPPCSHSVSTLGHRGWVEFCGRHEIENHPIPPELIAAQGVAEVGVCISPFIRGTIRADPGTFEKDGDGRDAQEVEHGEDAGEDPRKGARVVLLMLLMLLRG